MRFTLLRRREEEKEKISIKSELAYIAVILANPSLGSYELSERLLEVREMGYDICYRFRKDPEEGIYSGGLNGFLSILEYGGHTRGDFVNASSLNEHGVAFFEHVIFGGFDRSFGTNLRFLEDVGLDVDLYLERYIEARSEN